MTIIQPFSAEQERALINMRQRYDVWIEAERELFAMPYDLKRKKIGEYEYLYEIFDRIGNGKSLGPWDDEKEGQFENYKAAKAALKERRDGARDALNETSRIARALRLPMLSADAGPILREADRRSLLDLLVRGLRSGLPVTETLNVVSQEVPGPVGQEFKGIVERIRIGRTMEESLQETADRLGIPEFNFFCITLAIQRETGGNLAETLSNLGDVLRKRSQMKLKIKAMSSESKASAYIVGSLPFIVFVLIWWVNPNYLAGFFTDDRLIVAGLGGMVWMSIGAFIMAKMVSFEI